MDIAIKLVLALSLVGCASAAKAAEVPKLNVERMCRDSAAADPSSNYDVKRCVASEHEARDELAGKWATYSAEDQKECTTMATMGGSASYVELITCLNLKHDVRQQNSSTPPQDASPRKQKRR